MAHQIDVVLGVLRGKCLCCCTCDSELPVSARARCLGYVFGKHAFDAFMQASLILVGARMTFLDVSEHSI